MRTLYLECNMGAAGDMLTAALYQLLPEEQKKQFMEKMNSVMPEVSVEAEIRTRCGINGTGIRVTVNGEEEEAGHDPMHEHEHSHDHEHEHSHDHEHEHSHSHEHEHEHDHGHEHSHEHEHEHEHEHGHAHTHVHRGMAQIMAYLESFDLPEGVKKQAAAVYGEIARAESLAHGKPVEEVHFHEVGALDAVADVTGACYALYLLAPEQVLVSPVNVGNGMVRAAHGILPVPAPATAEILKGVPNYMNPERIGELCTPTGAALLKTFADGFGAMPVMQVHETGYGMGQKEFAAANCVRAFLGDTAENCAGPNQQIWELAVNVDDMTAEEMGFALETLLAKGALDAFAVPIVMKKSRPAHMLTCLCRDEDADRFAQLMLQYTTSFGVRRRHCGRYALDVSFSETETPYGPVKKKNGCGYGVKKSKTEYEDAARLARENSVPVSEVLAAAAQCKTEAGNENR